MIPFRNLSCIPFYTDEQLRVVKQWWQSSSLPKSIIMPGNRLLPFQIEAEEIVEPLTISLLDESDTLVQDITSLLINNGLVVKDKPNTRIIVNQSNQEYATPISEGFYFIQIVDDSGNVWTSDLIQVCRSTDELVQIEFWNNEDFVASNGDIVDYAFPYRNRFFAKTDIANPSYPYAEEVTEQEFRIFPQVRQSKKQYEFWFVTTEPICDLFQLARISDFIEISYKGVSWNVEEFVTVVEWQSAGDVARLTCQFVPNTVLRQIGRSTTILIQPDDPENFSVSLGADRTMVLMWEHDFNTETGFQVERSIDGNNWSLIAELPANTITYRDEGPLLENTIYFYRVRAVNGPLSSAWVTDSQTTYFALEMRTNESTGIVFLSANNTPNFNAWIFPDDRIEQRDDGIYSFLLQDYGFGQDSPLWYLTDDPLGLTVLFINGGRIFEINLDGFTNLDQIIFYSSALTQLDLSPVPNLTELRLSTPGGLGNEAQLDLVLLPVNNLSVLVARSSQIQSVDSFPANISYIDLWDNNLTGLLSIALRLNLTYCDASLNFITDVDVGGLGASLIDLRLFFNNITSFTDIDGLNTLSSLQFLYMSNGNNLGQRSGLINEDIDITGMTSLRVAWLNNLGIEVLGAPVTNVLEEIRAQNNPGLSATSDWSFLQSNALRYFDCSNCSLGSDINTIVDTVYNNRNNYTNTGPKALFMGGPNNATPGNQRINDLIDLNQNFNWSIKYFDNSTGQDVILN